jgi:hypothetical protein
MLIAFLCVTGNLMLARAAQAQPLEPAPSEGRAESGFLIQTRIQSQGGLLSLGGGPGFLLGYQMPSVAVGLGFDLMRVGVSDDEFSVSGTLFQFTPTVLVDVWRSNDGRTRANLVGSVGYGRASLSAEGESCVVDVDGNETCSPDESSVSATLIPVSLGLGGDYFLSKNFGVGAEAGVRAWFVTGLEQNDMSTDGSANTQFAYGLIRATLLLD